MTASRRHNAPKLRQVKILARESQTTLPRFVASLSPRAAKRPFPAVGLNVAEGWKAEAPAVPIHTRPRPVADVQKGIGLVNPKDREPFWEYVAGRAPGRKASTQYIAVL
jgi:hypothetical protein